jgi:hypothetical protein
MPAGTADAKCIAGTSAANGGEYWRGFNQYVSSCADTNRDIRLNDFFDQTVKYPELFEAQSAIYTDLMSTFSNVLGTQNATGVANTLDNAIKPLEARREELEREIEKLQQNAGAKNADFIDNVEDPQPKAKLNTLQDWILFLLFMTYLFMNLVILANVWKRSGGSPKQMIIVFVAQLVVFYIMFALLKFLA